MGRRLQVIDPVCRVMTKDIDGTATFAVYGPNRKLVWLAVHTITPTVVRLWPLVVRFLRDTLDELVDSSNSTLLWRLPASSVHPEYLVVRTPEGDPWLHIFAAAPNAIRLTADRIAFLRDALAELPTMAADRVDRHRSPRPGLRRATS